MRLILLSIALSAFASEAQAISRHTSTSMSCDQVQATIREEGAAIMRYTSTRVAGLPRYGRYVSDRSFCKLEETTRLVSIPAADTKSCSVRECELVDYDDELLLFRD